MKFFVIARAFLYIFYKLLLDGSWLVGWLAGWLVELVGVCGLGKLVGLVSMCKLVLAMLLFVASKLRWLVGWLGW